MISREISKLNLIEIILLPLLFINIFLSGIILLIYLSLVSYWVFAGWCLVAGVIVASVVLFYSYEIINNNQKQLIDNGYPDGRVYIQDIEIKDDEIQPKN